MTRHELTSGALSLSLAPACGGAVAGFWLNRRSGPITLLRPLPDNATDAAQAAMFPMLPFANCIRDNRFFFGGRDWEVSPNMADTRLNFHGSGWRLPWQVEQLTASTATLSLDADDGIWRYTAEQIFALDETGLSVGLSITNRAEDTMPFGFGFHPWFPRHGDGMVQFDATGLWSSTPDGEAIALQPVGPDTNFSTPHAPPHHYLNTCYTGWSGHAKIIWPREKLALAMTADTALSNLMVHVPATAPETICLEPQSNAPCGFDGLSHGHCSQGVHILSRNQTITSRMTLQVCPYPTKDSNL